MKHCSLKALAVIAVWMWLSGFASAETVEQPFTDRVESEDLHTSMTWGTFSKASIRTALEHMVERYPGFTKGTVLLTELESVEDDPTALYAFARRALVEENPLLRSKELLYVERRQYPKDHHNTATIFQTGEINHKSFRRVAGASLKKRSLSDHTETVLMETQAGMIRDPEVSFDGRRIILSYRKDYHSNYHIYELNADGENLKELTSLEDVDDIDPFYMSGGQIGFSSTREPKFCACNRHIMANLFKMEKDGANIHQIGKSIEFEGHGIQMPDGRILYNRWEYVDRNFGGAQGLWIANADGTNHALYMWQSTPHPLLNARPLPGSNKVIAIVSSCHDRPWGALAILDRSRGVEGKAPVVMIWPESARERIADENQSYAGLGGFDHFKELKVKYEDPYPLSEHFFLVSRTHGPADNEITAVYLMDTFGNEIMVHKSDQPKYGCYDPMLIAPSAEPARMADKTDFARTDGMFIVVNVYDGTHMKGVEPGSVKYLRVVDNPPKMTWTRSHYGGQGAQAPAMNFHDFDNKRVLGTIPVEADGSVQFSVPTDTFIYLQLLDEDGKMIQSMRSGMAVMPGEINSCIGCHDDRNAAPPPAAFGSLQALRLKPNVINDQTAHPANFSYQQSVQPIFDRHCIPCHDYGKEGGDIVNLSGDRTSMFCVSYIELHRKKMINTVGGGANRMFDAYEWGSHRSRLVKILDEGHNDVKLSTDEYRTLVTWIDLNAPYYPDYTSAYPDHPGGRSPLTFEEHKELEQLSGIKKLDFYAHNKAPYFNFDRPRHSPILSHIKDEAGQARVLDIIRTGSGRLERTARNDMAGYVPSKEDRRRMTRYDELFERELLIRQAKSENQKVYDPHLQVRQPVQK